jgi:hypothetical protein
MATHRSGTTTTKARTRYGNARLIVSITASALILSLNAGLAFGQQPTVDPNPSISAQGAQQQPAVPDTVSLPEGMSIQVRTTDYFSFDHDGSGGHFIGVLTQPVVAVGLAIAHAGQYVVGDVTNSGKKATTQLHLSQLVLADGELLQIETSTITAEGNTPPQSSLTFNLTKSALISITRGRVAFRSVTPEDYTDFPLGNGSIKIPYGYDPPCCVDRHGYGAFAGDGYGYSYYYGAGYFPPPVQIRYYGWHGKRWGW